MNEINFEKALKRIRNICVSKLAEAISKNKWSETEKLLMYIQDMIDLLTDNYFKTSRVDMLFKQLQDAIEKDNLE